jgi:hypothetical protein
LVPIPARDPLAYEGKVKVRQAASRPFFHFHLLKPLN